MPGQIVGEGCRLLDALTLRVEAAGGWLDAGGPGLTDFAVWGQVAPMLCWPMRTPVAEHAKAIPSLRAWHDRLLEPYIANQRIPVAAFG